MIHRNFKSNPRIIRQRMVHIVIFISMIFVLYSLGFLAHDPLLKRIPNRQNLGPHVRNHYQVENTFRSKIAGPIRPYDHFYLFFSEAKMSVGWFGIVSYVVRQLK